MEKGGKYGDFVKSHAPKTNSLKNCIKAFLSGGAVCCLGEGLSDIYTLLNAGENAPVLASVTLMLIAAVLTGIGVFDRIAKHTGAGTLVPITGFSNAMISQSIDSKAEGMILGVGTKMFSVAGPVIVYGAVSGALYGLIYWIVSTI